MAANLIVLGLVIIAVAILLHLVAWLITIAIPVGAVLVIIGVIWYLATAAKRPG
jgi:hypothetical protein